MAAKKARGESQYEKELEAKMLAYTAQWFVSAKMKERGAKPHDYYRVVVKNDKVLATNVEEQMMAKLHGTPAPSPIVFDVQEVVAWKAAIDKPKTIKMGTFEVVSGEMVVSDPCYSDDTWCMGFLQNVANGTWEAEIRTGEEGRVAKLYATLKGAKRGRIWKEAKFQVGVDSGQAGFWDKPCYRTKQEGNKKLISSHWESIAECEEKDEKGTGVFYATCCSLTCGDDDDNGANTKGGVMVGGCVSSSGYGDGGYTCYYQQDKRGIFTVCIQFM